MINFLHTYLPQPVVFSLGAFNVYWYGLLIVIGILLGFWVIVKLGKQYNIKSEDILELGLYLIGFGLIGGRLYHVFLELDYYLSSPLAIFKVWQGGLAIHGVLIAGIIVLIVWSKKKKISFWQLADLLVPAVALGQAFGRWGNYFNQELFGRPTDLPWGIPIETINRPAEYLNQQFFHPTFLYESIANLLIFVILFSLHKRKKQTQGFVFLLYLILYSLVRLTTEFWRIDTTITIGYLRWPQIISLLIIIACLIIWQQRQRALTK